MDLTTITIVGAGTMGANIALNLAAHGLAVRLTDVSAEQLTQARATVRTNALFLQEHGLLAKPAEEILPHVVYELGLGRALAESQLVIEAVTESLPLKQGLFEELDRRCASDVIFASNTSTFLPTALAVPFTGGERTRRFMILHYWNPAHLVPLVEIVPHPAVDAEVLANVKRLLERCGKHPVVLQKAVPGFIGNRLAFALQREAMELVSQGVASPEEIDTVVRAGFGRRIPITGIFGTADLGGLDIYLAICKTLFPELSTRTTVPLELERLVEEGKLGVKSGEGWHSYTTEQKVDLRESLAKELVRRAELDRPLASIELPPKTSRFPRI